MSTVRVYYVPPPNSPPFEFECGRMYVFMPPDKYWKRVPKTVVVGIIWNNKLNQAVIDPKTGKAKEVLNEIQEWVPDVEKNKLLADGSLFPPKNYLDLSRDALVLVNNGAHRQFTQYLKKESDVMAEQRRHYNEIQIEHDRKMAELDRKHALALRRKQQAVDAAEADAQVNERPAIMVSRPLSEDSPKPGKKA